MPLSAMKNQNFIRKIKLEKRRQKVVTSHWKLAGRDLEILINRIIRLSGTPKHPLGNAIAETTLLSLLAWSSLY